MKIPPGWRDADALTKRIPDKGLHASMFGTGWPQGQGLNRWFVTLRIAPRNTCHQAPGLCGELLEHHPIGVGDAARPPEGNLRAGFPRTLGLRRAVGVGRRGYAESQLEDSQKGIFELDFRVPSGCAEQLASGAADIGIVPSFELTRQDLEVIPGVGIACHGAARSILLVSSRPAARIRTLAVDSSSRTSVQLARIILERRYGAEPVMTAHAPDLEAMLRVADAALIIGDPALRIEPECLPYHVYDLGAEWVEMTGLPMVFAVWAGRRASVTPLVAEAFRESCRYGLGRIRSEEHTSELQSLRHLV